MIDGLEFFHENKIIHGDLKPENVMYAPAIDSWKIGDFHINIETNFINKIPSLQFINNYKSPENTVTFQSDLFSLGLIIWEVAQLISEKDKGNLFLELVLDLKTSLVKTNLTSNISTTIIHLTQRELQNRMECISELEDFRSELIACLNSNFISCLGFGSYGLVLKIKNRAQKFSALKLIYKDHEFDKDEDKQLKRKCLLLKDKYHKNIVKLEAVFEFPLELKDIENISDLIEDNTALEKLAIIQFRVNR